jgi:hypothetical protein
MVYLGCDLIPYFPRLAMTSKVSEPAELFVPTTGSSIPKADPWWAYHQGRKIT